MPAFSSIGNLPGALRINYAFPAGAQEDIGGRVQLLISQVAVLVSNVTTIQSGIVSANASGVTFSSTSAGNFTAYLTGLSNFAST